MFVSLMIFQFHSPLFNHYHALKKALSPQQSGRGESPGTWLCLPFGSGHQITVWTMALHSAAQVLNDQEVAMSGPVGRIPWVCSALTGPGSEWMAGEHVGGNKRSVATQLEPWLPFDAGNREVKVKGGCRESRRNSYWASCVFWPPTQTRRHVNSY